jgi:hypothetical protein
VVRTVSPPEKKKPFSNFGWFIEGPPRRSGASAGTVGTPRSVRLDPRVVTLPRKRGRVVSVCSSSVAPTRRTDGTNRNTYVAGRTTLGCMVGGVAPVVFRVYELHRSAQS